jgi:hypothetical protein
MCFRALNNPSKGFPSFDLLCSNHNSPIMDVWAFYVAFFIFFIFMGFSVWKRTKNKILKTRQVKYFEKSKRELTIVQPPQAWLFALSWWIWQCHKIVWQLSWELLYFWLDELAVVICSSNSPATAQENILMTLGLQVQSVVSTEYFPHTGDSRVISNYRGIGQEVSPFLLF